MSVSLFEEEHKKKKHNSDSIDETSNIKNADLEKVSYFQLFKFGDKKDKAMLIVGSLCAIGVGVSFPLNLLIFNQVVDGFTGENSITEALVTMKRVIKWYVILAFGTFLLAFIQMLFFSFSARRQSRRIRLLLFKQILRQDVGWFDQQSLGDIITKLTSNVDQIESGIGERLSRFLQNFIMFVSCFVTAFSNEWKLALVGLSTTPLIVLAFTVMGLALSKFSVNEQKAYSSANSIASEVLTYIRTVFAFAGQENESKRYESELGKAAKVSFKKNVVLGFGIGMIGGSIFISAGLTFWYGVKLIVETPPGVPPVESGTIVSVVLAFLVGSIGLGLVLPEFSYFARATAAATNTFWIIDRIPDIDKDESGIIPSTFAGKIEFKNVSFAYPMRPDVTTLKNFSISIIPGQTVAIVGPSGSGKSTTIQLMQRFYDPSDGIVLVDGTDLRDYDLKWFRKQLGVVSQEPVLFSGTITENISMGNADATTEEIEAASKMADAHDFILGLPDAYDTVIAEGGGGMSGGQKQRIAIARALLRNPRILLLDEATSALDTHSEHAVQQALERARTGRTVIMVAHRLTTVRDADRIIVVDRGELKEAGTHNELVQLNGIYAHMLTTQEKHKPVDDADSQSENEDDDDTDEPILFTKEDMKRENIWMRSKKMSETESILSSISGASLLSPNVEKHPVWRAFKLNRPEFCFFFLGLFCAILGGLIQPAFAFLYSQMFQVLSETNKTTKYNTTCNISGLMALLGLIRLLLQMSSSSALGYAGAQLTKRTRSMMFKSILTQEVGWFDRVDNQPGILTARLATEVSSLEMVTGAQLGSILEACCLIVASLVLAFAYSWQLSLVNICFLPLLVTCSALQMMQNKASLGVQEVRGSQVVQEALSAERTVFSFGLEDHFYEKFRNKSSLPHSARIKEAMAYALVNAVSSSLSYLQTAASFYVGALLMASGKLLVVNVFRTFSAFNFGAQAIGRIAGVAPDYKKALMKIKAVFLTMDRKTKMVVNEGDYPDTPFSGSIEFRNVYFRYPTRKNIRILRRFSHKVMVGQSVALVGQSGCGKSTVLQLVQRLYDVNPHGADSGIFLDGRDIRELAPNYIRQQIGIVSQEPNLFNLTIRENIAYGSTSQELTMEDIIEAAKDANVHDFVDALPEGYETMVGARGSQLSGGQKQRIAIARALIRKPRLLLLDEATSALDNESERVVQVALDEAMSLGDRTSLVVAHRLTTVENCSFIVVLQDGQKVESGPPDALMHAKGVYYTLHNVDAAVEPH